MEGENMVTVIRGLPDAGLCVTLLDGSKQYTLMPNGVSIPAQPSKDQRLNHQYYYPVKPEIQPTYPLPVPTYPLPATTYPQPVQGGNAPSKGCQYCQYQAQQASPTSTRSREVNENSTQAVDGRYVSTYKIAHCNLCPTNPQVQSSEFPPQKTIVGRGRDNFQVGGLGSAENGHRNNNWKLNNDIAYEPPISQSPERTTRHQSAFVKRHPIPNYAADKYFGERNPSEPDPFADSLRKYPMSSDKSSEIMERLVNYNQYRNNFSPTRARSNVSPSRSESQNSHRDIGTSSLRTKCSVHSANNFAQVPPNICKSRGNDESPMRDRRRRGIEFNIDCRPAMFEKNFDHYARDSCQNARDITSNVKETCRNSNKSPNPKTIASEEEKGLEIGYLYIVTPKCLSRRNQLYTVAMQCGFVATIETQASVPKVSREVATVPRPKPFVRNVAISVTPDSTASPAKNRRAKDTENAKSIQTVRLSKITIEMASKTHHCSSSIEIFTECKENFKQVRKTQSQRYVKSNEKVSDELIQLLQRLAFFAPIKANNIKTDIVDRIKKLHEQDENGSVNKRFDQCFRDSMFSEINIVNYIHTLSDGLTMQTEKFIVRKITPTNIYRAELCSFRDSSYTGFIESLIEDWIKHLPLKMNITKDMAKKAIQNIKSLILKTNFDDKIRLRIDIMKIFKDLPIIGDNHNLQLMIQEKVEQFLNKIDDLKLRENMETVQFSDDIEESTTPMNGVLKQLVANETMGFMKRFDLNICNESLQDLVNDITQFISEVMKTDATVNWKEYIIDLLHDMLHITPEQANYFATNIINKVINNSYKNNDTLSQQITALPYESNVSGFTPNHVNNDFKELCTEINEWIDSLNIHIEDENKRKIINHLANNIIERHSYYTYYNLSTNEGVYDDEIKHLKYQLYRCLNKIDGIKNIDSDNCARELLNRIRRVLEPSLIEAFTDNTLNLLQNNLDAPGPSNAPSIESNLSFFSVKDQASDQVNTPSSITDINKEFKGLSVYSMLDKRKQSSSLNDSKKRRSSSPCNRSSRDGNCNQTSDMNNTDMDKHAFTEGAADYEIFLREWVNDIPIENQETAEKQRQAIFNGVMQVNTKLQMNPEALYNRYYYKDVFEDEVDALLDGLPKTPQLANERPELKSALVEKTLQLNDLLVKALLKATYKQQLLDSVNNNLPIRNQAYQSRDTSKAIEDNIKLRIIESFILFTRFKDGDKIKANIYKNKIKREIDELVDNLKKHHGKPLHKIDFNLYKESIFMGLEKVPLPSDETINNEADEILLWTEVDQWSSDLPIVPNDDESEIITRRKFTDILAKKLHDLEVPTGNIEDNGERARAEIKSYLMRMPLEASEIVNIDFMTEELMNRLKNRLKDVVATSDEGKKRNIVFVEPYDYDEFSREMPLSSSFTDDPNARRPQADLSSIVIVGGKRVQGTRPPRVPEESEHSSDFMTIPDATPQNIQQSCASHGIPPQVSPCSKYQGSQQSSFNRPGPSNQSVPRQFSQGPGMSPSSPGADVAGCCKVSSPGSQQYSFNRPGPSNQSVPRQFSQGPGMSPSSPGADVAGCCKVSSPGSQQSSFNRPGPSNQPVPRQFSQGPGMSPNSPGADVADCCKVSSPTTSPSPAPGFYDQGSQRSNFNRPGPSYQPGQQSFAPQGYPQANMPQKPPSPYNDGLARTTPQKPSFIDQSAGQPSYLLPEPGPSSQPNFLTDSGTATQAQPPGSYPRSFNDTGAQPCQSCSPPNLKDIGTSPSRKETSYRNTGTSPSEYVPPRISQSTSSPQPFQDGATTSKYPPEMCRNFDDNQPVQSRQGRLSLQPPNVGMPKILPSNITWAPQDSERGNLCIRDDQSLPPSRSELPDAGPSQSRPNRDVSCATNMDRLRVPQGTSRRSTGMNAEDDPDLAPNDFSTPENEVPRPVPERPGRKSWQDQYLGPRGRCSRNTRTSRRDSRTMGTDSENESDGLDGQICKCMKKFLKCRTRIGPMCHPCDNYDMEMPFCPLMSRHPYFF